MDNRLFKEFPPVTTEQWESVIKEDLKGADYDKKLVWKTAEGFSVKPYYRAEDINGLSHLNAEPGVFPYVRGNKTAHNNWQIRQDIKVNKPADANTKAVDAISKGATAIGFICNGKVKSAEAIVECLKNIDLSLIAIYFVADNDASDFYPLLSKALSALNVDSKKLHGALDLDPLGTLTTGGNYYHAAEKDMETLVSVVKTNVQQSPCFRPISVNGAIFQNSGSSIVQEMAFSLAMANEYMYLLTNKGVKADEAAQAIQFNFAVSANYFMEIAKIRAFRMLWTNVVEAYKPISKESAKASIHSVTADWNSTLYDPYVNMLRGTTEAMSAVLGGTDSLTVKPFDASYKESTVQSERAARNTQIVIKEEAYFDKVVDPAAGSYYIESLTQSIANEAWKIFLNIESAGGYIEALKKEMIQKEIESVANKKINDIATRRDTVLGTNQYPNFKEAMLKEIDTTIYGTKEISGSTVVKPLKMKRAVMAFEDLRLKTERSGKRPKVFMLTIGSLSMRLARSQFSSNFFACAGFEVIDNNGFKTIEEGIAAAEKAKADIVVLCSSDEEYATLAPELYNKLGKKAIMVVAGSPACTEELKAIGIENFISMKSNLLDTLSYYQNLLNIK